MATNMLTKVRAFHLKHCFPTRRTPAEVVLDGVALMRIRLMVEETAEVGEALDQGDRVAIAHELADLLYVTLGTAVALGLPVRLSPPTPRDVMRATFTQLHARLAKLTIEMARQHRFDPVETAVKLSEFVDVQFALASALSIPLVACFEEVHRANMTKEVMDEGGKGGKGAGFVPADIARVLEQAATHAAA